MASIFKAQNEEKHINQLAAQRQLYTESKKLQWYLFILAVPTTVIIFVLGNLFSSLQNFSTVWGAAIAAIELIAMQFETRYLTKAAKIQELFDCEVLNMEWNSIQCFEKPDVETIVHYSKKHLTSPEKKEALKNWYFEKEDCLPIHYARLICQRSNLSWDMQLRLRFSRLVRLAVILVFLFSLILAMLLKLTVGAFAFFWIVPMLPAYIWGSLQWHSQNEAVDNLKELRKIIHQIWDDIFKNSLSVEILEKYARDLQEQIYSIRKNSLPIPDKVYQIFRDKDDNTMYCSVDQLCQELINRLDEK